jgi:TusA-related sulfurtransferase
LYAKKALNSLEGGDVLKLLATDPNTAQDFTLFCQQTGHELLGVETLEPGQYPHDFVIWLRKVKREKV